MVGNNITVYTENIQSLDEECTDTIILISNDKKEFVLSKHLVQQSIYLKNILLNDSMIKEIYLSLFHSLIMEKIIKWLTYHEQYPSKDIPKPLPHSNLKNIVGEWDANFVDCDLTLIYELLMASNFLEITPLLDLCCAKITSLMIGKTPKKIQEIFDLSEEYNSEEEERIQKEFVDYL